ncbi:MULTISPECIES: hypothetical protein [unclassified Sphingomonas]|uniref:hypothetical protein n=1 Tax=unclassified Sphingomonas TaxID=196159 RepID=UPI00082C8082|nr:MULTISPECIES: hypothetical protein [unclassified Sphingomonas]
MIALFLIALFPVWLVGVVPLVWLVPWTLMRPAEALLVAALVILWPLTLAVVLVERLLTEGGGC